MSKRQPLSLGLKLAYGLGAVGFGIKDIGLKIFLLVYYNQVLGLTATWVGLASGVALVIDAAIDPVIGYWSDNLHSRWGRRHPPMYAAVLPISLAYGLLWDPPGGLTQPQLTLYLIGMIILVRVLISVYEVPNAALAPDLTDDYDERTSVIGYRVLIGLTGGLAVAVVALIAFIPPEGSSTPGQLVAAGYVRYGWISAIVMLVTSLASALGTHRRIPLLRHPPPRQKFELRRSFGEILESLSQPSLRTLLLAILFANLAGGLSSTLGLYYNTFFWELSAPQTLGAVLGLFIGAGIALPLGTSLSRRYGKKAAATWLIILSLINGPLPQLLRLADWFPANHTPLLLPLLIVHSVIVTTLGVAATIMIIAMVSDVVEADELATGRRSEGVLLAGSTFVTKCATGLGLLFSGLLLDLIRFPEHAEQGHVDPAILRNLVLVYTPATTILYVLMLAFLSTYRIDRATHEANLLRLAEAEIEISLNP